MPGFNRREYHISEDRTSLCLWQVDKEMFYSYISHAQDYFQKRFFRSWDLLPLNRALVELFNNIIDHSESMVSGYVYTKYFQARNQFIISLCDFGNGIPSTVNKFLLETQGKMLTEVDALDKAFEAGFTVKSKMNNGGLGLDIVLTITKTFSSSLLVVSNYALFVCHPDGRIVKKEMPVSLMGTLVVLTLNASYLSPLNKEEISIFHE
jgi:anti-sigma regulatory factor (Ser/Thr protein kinase)